MTILGGIQCINDEEENEEVANNKQKIKKDFSVEQLQYMRFIMLTENRIKELNIAKKFADPCGNES